MRIRTGVDLVKIDRISKHLKDERSSFFEKCFTEGENAYCMSHNSDLKKAESYAARFAAKEAASKALGTGICTENIGFKDFEVVLSDNGAPELKLYGEALNKVNEYGLISMSISITHEGDMACAVVNMLTDI